MSIEKWVKLIEKSEIRAFVINQHGDMIELKHNQTINDIITRSDD